MISEQMLNKSEGADELIEEILAEYAAQTVHGCGFGVLCCVESR